MLSNSNLITERSRRDCSVTRVLKTLAGVTLTMMALSVMARPGFTQDVQAQLRAPVTASSPSVEWSLPPRPNIIVSASGADGYARYTPFVCGAVNSRAWIFHTGERTLTWRDRWPATAATVRDDSIAADAVRKKSAAMVRACLAPYTPENTPVHELWGLGSAWLSVEAYEPAATAFTRLLRTMDGAPLLERAALLQQLVSVYATKPVPMQLTPALTYMQQLDALGPQAVGYQLAAHNALFGAAYAIDSIPFMAEQGKIAMGLARALKGDLQHEWIGEVMVAFQHHADLDGRRGNFAAAMDTLTAALRDFRTEYPNAMGPIYAQIGSSIQYGKPVHPIEAHYVYLAGQANPLPSIDGPPKGKVSIILNANHHFVSNEDVPKYTLVQQLIEKYGKDLNVVMILETTGNFDRRFLTPDEEAPLIRDYVQQYLKLPITTVVWKRPVIEKRPDGQLLYAPSPNVRGEVVLIDKQQRVRNIDGGLRLRVTHMVEELVREP